MLAADLVDHIFHLAALYKAGDWPVHHPATQFNVNMKINVNALEGWRLDSAEAISADGRTIVGGGINPAGDSEAYLVVLPEPSAAALMLVGYGVLLRRRRKTSDKDIHAGRAKN